MKLKGQMEVVDREQDLKLQINKFFQVKHKNQLLIGQFSEVELFEDKNPNMGIKISTLDHKKDVSSTILDQKFQQVFLLIPQKDRKLYKKEPLKFTTTILNKD
jgi:hypothetical protein